MKRKKQPLAGLIRKATNLFFRVLAKPEPLFSDAASKIANTLKDRFFVSHRSRMDYTEYEVSVRPIVWRIKLQVIAMQFREYENPHTTEQEREQWKQRIWLGLWQLNQKAQELHTPPQLQMVVLDTLAQNAAIRSLDEWTHSLACMFMSVSMFNVDTLRIEC